MRRALVVLLLLAVGGCRGERIGRVAFALVLVWCVFAWLGAGLAYLGLRAERRATSSRPPIMPDPPAPPVGGGHHPLQPGAGRGGRPIGAGGGWKSRFPGPPGGWQAVDPEALRRQAFGLRVQHTPGTTAGEIAHRLLMECLRG